MRRRPSFQEKAVYERIVSMIGVLPKAAAALAAAYSPLREEELRHYKSTIEKEDALRSEWERRFGPRIRGDADSGTVRAYVTWEDLFIEAENGTRFALLAEERKAVRNRILGEKRQDGIHIDGCFASYEIEAGGAESARRAREAALTRPAY